MLRLVRWFEKGFTSGAVYVRFMLAGDPRMRLIRVKPRASKLMREHADACLVSLFGWEVVLIIAHFFQTGCAPTRPFVCAIAHIPHREG